MAKLRTLLCPASSFCSMYCIHHEHLFQKSVVCCLAGASEAKMRVKSKRKIRSRVMALLAAASAEEMFAGFGCSPCPLFQIPLCTLGAYTPVPIQRLPFTSYYDWANNPLQCGPGFSLRNWHLPTTNLFASHTSFPFPRDLANHEIALP